MVMQFTLQELMIFLVLAVGIATGILMLPILLNIKKVTGTLRSLVETNQESFQKTMKTVPGIIEHGEQISSNLKDTTNKLKVSVPVILQNVESASGSAKKSLELAGVTVEKVGSGINDILTSFTKDTPEYATGFAAYLPIVKEVLQLVIRAFSSNK